MAHPPDGRRDLSGTLTDARGPIAASVAGDVLTIRFTMRHGLKVEQRLRLLPGGQTAQNHLDVRKFGMLVAALDERISRVEATTP